MYNSIGRQSYHDDLYKFINTNEIQDSSKRKSPRIVFDPFIFTLLLLLFIIIIVIFVYYLIIILPPVIMNFNNLISNTIPNELEYYHSLLKEHNQTLVQVEKNVLSYINISNIVINNKTLHKSNHIIDNINGITSTLNITQIQRDLDNIVNILNRIIPHRLI